MTNALALHDISDCDIGDRPALKYINIYQFIIDHRYQRTVESRASQSLIEDIALRFNWRSFGAVTATDNGDGTFCLIDGQHRVEAVKRRGEIDAVPTLLLKDLTFKEQAETFIGLNRDRVNVSPLAIFWAQHAARDPFARDLVAAMTCAGVTLRRTPALPNNMKPGETIALVALKKIFDRGGRDDLLAVLDCIMTAYPDTPGHLSRRVIKGVDNVLQDGLATADHITQALQQYSTRDLELEARQYANQHGASIDDAFRTLLMRKATACANAKGNAA